MKINEIFYSLQGEGYWTGTAAVFVRFSGCNLNCSFCDTSHQDGTYHSEKEIIDKVCEFPTSHVIFTGGEPTLQLTGNLVEELHKRAKYIHIETNGTIRLSEELEKNIDWITVSPKNRLVNIQRIDEMKVVFEDVDYSPNIFENLNITHPDCRFLQPCDVGETTINKNILERTIEYIKEHPQWRLSLQTHKLIGIQ